MRIEGGLSPEWIEGLYLKWREDRNSLTSDWDAFFLGYECAAAGGRTEGEVSSRDLLLKHSGIQSLIYRYRDVGHLLACTDPLSPCPLNHPLLDLQEFGLDPSDLDIPFHTRRYHERECTLRSLLESMRETYCARIGVEFMHIQEPAERQWLIDRMEPCRNHTGFSSEEKLNILDRLNEAVLFEEFLQRKFPGQKRFSLEGGETLLAVIDALARKCPSTGISDMVIGMSHRGRLNVLAHIFGKPYENILAEFEDTLPFGFSGDGDMKYHKGHSSDAAFADGSLHMTLAPNPSHLEAVTPVVQGKCRARQDRYGEGGRKKVLPLLIHGDAAFAGQGVVMETLNLSRLDGYSTGGSIHIVLNNQIGFTTLPEDARSTRYATDAAKMLACPVFHIHGESPEDAVHAARLALQYRQTFGRDAVIELVCYRRHGHNEGDEPSFTQPAMYRAISERQAVNRLYAGKLAEEGLAPSLIQASAARVTLRFEAAIPEEPNQPPVGFRKEWEGVSREYEAIEVDSSVSAERILNISRSMASMPPGFSPHRKIASLIQKRFEDVLKGESVDWGNAESLAFATILEEGNSVRLSGQDSRRGTFSHRHAVLHDMEENCVHIPLEAARRDGALFSVWDSPLSEFAVLGFEYGYSLETPRGLVIWEAQFGDFANGAQVIVDQFISSGEARWNRSSGLVMMLPHGYEGQGAEHSSARIERYLQLCANNNMFVANPSTPAQMFHLLRRHVMLPYRKPLIIFTPKGLLRHPQCISPISDIVSGSFREVMAELPERSVLSKILFCSGRIVYDLKQEMLRQGRDDVGIVTFEQLYPLRLDKLGELFSTSGVMGVKTAWVQEEPENMGAWPFVRQHLAAFAGNVAYVGRSGSACPATGSHRIHHHQQQEIIAKALEI